MGDLLRRRSMMVANGGSAQVEGWLYHFNGNLLSSGTEDFGFTGIANYVSGLYGQAYLHKTADYDGESDVFGIKAVGISKVPDLTSDFTLSFWFKSLTDKRGHPFIGTKTVSASGNATTLANAANVASGYTVTRATVAKSNEGSSILWSSEKLNIRIVNRTRNYASNYQVTFPTSFNSTEWHHYALTRSNGTLMFFVDGQRIFTVSTSTAIVISDQLCIGNNFSTDASNPTDLQSTSYGDVVEDLYIAEFCKWDDDFDPYSITY